MTETLFFSRFAKFILAGLFITLLDFAFFRFGLAVGLTPNWARVFGFIMALALSFVIHRGWTFESTHPWVRSLVAYLITRLLSFLTAQGVFIALHDGMGWGLDWAFFGQAPVQPALNFIFGYFVVFRRQP